MLVIVYRTCILSRDTISFACFVSVYVCVMFTGSTQWGSYATTHVNAKNVETHPALGLYHAWYDAASGLVRALHWVVIQRRKEGFTNCKCPWLP